MSDDGFDHCDDWRYASDEDFDDYEDPDDWQSYADEEE